MNRKRVALTAIFLFLVQSLTTSQDLSAGTFSLNPPTKVSLTESQISFKQTYDALCMALVIYKLDAIQRYTKEAVKAVVLRDYADVLSGISGVRFDLDNMDIGKRGWTRYYPFSIGQNRFIIRLFLTKELAYQPKVPVLFEGAIENPAVTFQILPEVSSILKDCNIRPFQITRAPQEVSASL